MLDRRRIIKVMWNYRQLLLHEEDSGRSSVGGKSPYPGTNPTTLVQMLENGERLPKPYNAACSDEMYVKKAENGYYGVILLLIVT